MLINEYRGKRNYRTKQRGKLKYSANRYDNPYFEEKRKKPAKPHKPGLFSGPKAKLIFLSFLVLLIAGLGFLLYNPYFLIKNVSIDGQGRVSADSIRSVIDNELNRKVWFIFKGANLFLFDQKRVEHALNEKYALDTLAIDKKFPNKLEVYFDEKDYVLIWREGESLHYAGANGELITEVSLLEIKNKDYPIVENISNQTAQDKKIPISQKEIGYILNLFQEFKKHEQALTLEKFLVNNEINSVTLKILNGPEIIFNTEESIDKQMNKLLTLKEERLGDDFFKKTYINLRIGDSIFVR